MNLHLCTRFSGWLLYSLRTLQAWSLVPSLVGRKLMEVKFSVALICQCDFEEMIILNYLHTWPMIIIHFFGKKMQWQGGVFKYTRLIHFKKKKNNSSIISTAIRNQFLIESDKYIMRYSIRHFWSSFLVDAYLKICLVDRFADFRVWTVFLLNFLKKFRLNNKLK